MHLTIDSGLGTLLDMSFVSYMSRSTCCGLQDLVDHPIFADRTYGTIWHMKNSHWLKQYIHATRDDDRRQLLKQVVRAFEQDVLSKTDALPQGQLWWPCGQGVRWRNQFFVPTNCILSKKTRLFPCIFSEEFFQKIKNSRIFQSKKNVSTFLHFY